MWQLCNIWELLHSTSKENKMFRVVDWKIFYWKMIRNNVKYVAFPSITNKRQRYTIYLVLWNALHVSGGSSAHHQKLKIVYTASGTLSNLYCYLPRHWQVAVEVWHQVWGLRAVEVITVILFIFAIIIIIIIVIIIIIIIIIIISPFFNVGFKRRNCPASCVSAANAILGYGMWYGCRQWQFCTSLKDSWDMNISTKYIRTRKQIVRCNSVTDVSCELWVFV